MVSNNRKRLENLEQRSQAANPIIAVVDVRDLPAAEAAMVLDAKRAELAGYPAATLIILDN